MRNSLSERFWSKVDVKGLDECWDWLACIVKGYGIFWTGSRYTAAHRVAWELTNGDILEGKLVLHKCDNKKCVKPSHLYLGTQSDNMCDRAIRNPKNQGGHTKLSLKESRIIEGLKGSYPIAFVSQLFEVSNSTISRHWNK